jgi:hypothetical protein
MQKTKTASTPATEPKAHRSARTAAKKSAQALTAPEPLQQLAAAVEFDAATHHDEIAQVAYRNWLERTGSAEQDWIKAEMEIRAKYSR